MWGPDFHLDRPGASPPTLWLILCRAVSSTTLALSWKPQPIATWQTSHGIKWRKWKRRVFFCVCVQLCANHQLWVVLDRRRRSYVSSAAIVMLQRSGLLYVGGAGNTILIVHWLEVNQWYASCLTAKHNQMESENYSLISRVVRHEPNPYGILNRRLSKLSIQSNSITKSCHSPLLSSRHKLFEALSKSIVNFDGYWEMKKIQILR